MPFVSWKSRPNVAIRAVAPPATTRFGDIGRRKSRASRLWLVFQRRPAVARHGELELLGAEGHDVVGVGRATVEHDGHQAAVWILERNRVAASGAHHGGTRSYVLREMAEHVV